MGRRCPSRERTKVVELVLSEKFNWRAGIRAPALRRRGRAVLGKLVCLLLGIEHHLLISPLGKLSIRIEKRAVRRDLALLRWVHWVRLLVGVLVEGSRVKRLSVSVPSSLLLLNGVRILGVLWRRNTRGRRRGIVGRRHALAGNGGVGRVWSRRIHCVIFGGVPVLGDKNCHGLGKREREEKKEKKERCDEKVLFCGRKDVPA
jgi:hypothetical protein